MAITRTARAIILLLLLLTFLPFNSTQAPNFVSDLLLYNSVPFLALLLSPISLRSEPKSTRVPFQLAIFLWISGSIFSSLTAVFLLPGVIQLISNFLYLLFYPFMFIALPRMLRRSNSSSKIEIIDAAIVALGVSAICTAFLVNPVLPNFAGNFLDTFFAIIFPVADVILIALLFSIAPWHQLKAREGLLISGILIFAAADFINLWLSSTGRYRFGTWSDSLWLIALVLIFESTWHKSHLSKDISPIHPLFIAFAVIGSTGLLATLAIKPNYFPNFILGPTIATLILAFIRMFLALKEAEEIGSERQLARTDELTGLPNRRKFMADLTEFSNTEGALLLIDLNGFKPINDQYGHLIGDKLLQAVAHRFRRSLPSHATLARLGGDEFGALISGDYESTMESALALHASVTYPFAIAGEQIKIGVSVGFVTNDGTRDLMHRADQAMYKAKREDLGVCQL